MGIGSILLTWSSVEVRCVEVLKLERFRQVPARLLGRKTLSNIDQKFQF